MRSFKSAISFIRTRRTTFIVRIMNLNSLTPEYRIVPYLHFTMYARIFNEYVFIFMCWYALIKIY